MRVNRYTGSNKQMKEQLLLGPTYIWCPSRTEMSFSRSYNTNKPLELFANYQEKKSKK
jgi:hypothetical protein